MTSPRTTVIAAVAFAALSAWAQMPAGQASPGVAAVPAVSDQRMAMLDMQMKSMREMHEMHEKMMRARSPEERNALQPEHTKLMQDGMTMMGAAGSDRMSAMKGMHGTGALPGSAPTSGDLAIRQDIMEKHMALMQSMMLMMDQLPPAPVKP